jgi:hypothetical protein
VSINGDPTLALSQPFVAMIHCLAFSQHQSHREQANAAAVHACRCVVKLEESLVRPTRASGEPAQLL